MKELLGYKVGMTQMWDDKGRLQGVTLIHADDNSIVRLKDINFLAQAKIGKGNKPLQGVAKKIGLKGQNFWFKKTLADKEGKVGVADFKPGDVVSVTGRTKGKGFAGTIKRHGFHRGPVSHGSGNIRQPGSIGAQRPQRVIKGKKMAGHMGNQQFTVRGLEVLGVFPQEKLLALKGAVPGNRRAGVIVKEINA